MIGAQKDVKGYNVGKRIAIKSNQIQTKSKFSKTIDTQKTKLPLIKPIMIKADLKISDLLLQPKEYYSNTNLKIVDDNL